MSAYRHLPAPKELLVVNVEKPPLFPLVLTVSVFGILSIFVALPLATFIAPGAAWAVVGIASLLAFALARKSGGGRATAAARRSA